MAPTIVKMRHPDSGRTIQCPESKVEQWRQRGFVKSPQRAKSTTTKKRAGSKAARSESQE